MNPVITFAAKEVASTIIINTLWTAYKKYCKFCWKKFYKGEK